MFYMGSQRATFRFVVVIRAKQLLRVNARKFAFLLLDGDRFPSYGSGEPQEKKRSEVQMRILCNQSMSDTDSMPIRLSDIPEQFQNKKALSELIEFQLRFENADDQLSIISFSVEKRLIHVYEELDGRVRFTITLLTSCIVQDSLHDEDRFLEIIANARASMKIPGVNDGPKDEPYVLEDRSGGGTYVVASAGPAVKVHRVTLDLSVFDNNYYLPLPDALRTTCFVCSRVQLSLSLPDQNPRVYACTVVDTGLEGLIVNGGRLGGRIVPTFDIVADEILSLGQVLAELSDTYAFLQLTPEETGGLVIDPILIRCSAGGCKAVSRVGDDSRLVWSEQSE